MRNVLFGLWTALAALLLLEIGLRVFGDDAPQPIIASSNPRLVYELDPRHPEINSDGMRGREVDRAGLEGAFVIAILGDSHTYSVRATSYQTGYPAQLERALRRRGYGRTVAMNFGVPGYNTAQELEVLRSRALAFDPDLVILQYTENDSHICNYIAPRRPALNRLVYRSRAVVFLWKALLYRLRFGREQVFRFVARHAPDALLFTEGLVGTLPDADRVHPTDDPHWVPERYHYMLGRENLRLHLDAFGAAARGRGVALLATGFIDGPASELFHSAGFDTLPFGEIFQGVDIRRFGYRPEVSGDHLNDRGSAFVAEALALRIEERFGERLRADR